jgi:hypothetical protein
VLLHELGWKLTVHPDGTSQVVSPDGKTIHSHSPPARPGLRRTRPLPDPELYAGGAVDAFPEQVGVAVVAGVLLDHVDVDPAEVDVLLHEAAGVG